MSKIRVLLADDHRIFLAGLQKLLENDFDIVGAVGDGRALYQEAIRLKPDVIVADISMPSLNGVDAVRTLFAEGCTSKVIFLSMHGDALYINEALRTGAIGYVLKRDAPDQLVAAIRDTTRAKRTTPGGLSKAVSGAPLTAGSGELTPRQREIWQLLAEGMVPKEIGVKMGISVRTVEFHKYRLLQRLGVRTAAELTVLAIKHRIIG